MPNMLLQSTINSSSRAVGIGLHSGQRVEVTFRPAPVNTGIVFRRTDIIDAEDIRVSASCVSDTRMASTISSRNAKVQTVEHVMSACAGLGIDNLYIDLTAEEVPILDGSAASFVFLLQNAGIVQQDAPREFVCILADIEIREGDGKNLKWAKLAPWHGWRLDFSIDFDHPAVDGTDQKQRFELGQDDYVRQVARARTFGFTKEVEAIRNHGLALGGGMDNAIILDEHKILNADGLRLNGEFVQHKILDAMGDMYLLGKPILGAYSAFRSGHALNNQLLRKLLATQEAFEIRQLPQHQAPAGFSKLHQYW